VIVADASVVLDMLLGPGSPAGDRLADHFAAQDVVCAPHLMDAEVAQALRRLTARGTVTVEEAWSMIRLLADLPIERYSHRGLLPRVFDLRDNVSVCDGLYLALAEMVDRPLLTGDAALVGVPGCTAQVELLVAGGG
jgi:predicted nucleic acid-binding protein